MAKIGSKIQETRLRKGLTLDRIADDTNISVRFLAKIENDDFTGFPGEPYVVGFIRNYADYLGLDPEAVVALYREKGDGAPPSAFPTEQPAGASARAGAAAAAPAEGAEGAGADAVASAQDAGALPAQSGAGDGETDGGAEPAAPKPKRAKKPKAAAEAGPEQKAKAKSPPQEKKSPSAKAKEEPLPPPPPAAAAPDGRAPAAPVLRSVILGIVAISIVAVAALWIVAGGKATKAGGETSGPKATEYRVEGGPFEKRLYVGDSLLVPLEDDVYKIRLASIDESVGLETPFGPFELALGETAPIDPDKNGSADISLTLGDFEKGHPESGALLRVEFAPPETSDSIGGEVTVPENPAASQTVSPAADVVIMKSMRGPYPFVAQVSFRGNCLFRYEADRKEWVEKYYSKGESLTINATNALTIWASNAQAVKLGFQASGGKTTDLEIGAAGEITVKRISWSRAEGSSWALVSSELD
jgi:cytoskeletal protein RodZ